MELRGATDARRLITAYFEATFPARLEEVRGLFDLEAADLPDPKLYLDHPPFDVDRYPTLSVNATRMPSMRAEGTDGDGVHSWQAAYSIELVAWVSAVWGRVWDLRDDMTGAIRRHLLTTPAFALNWDDDDPIHVRVESVGMAEEYGEPVKQTGDLWGIGGLVAFNLVVPESITRPPLGVVVQTSVRVHPSLAE